MVQLLRFSMCRPLSNSIPYFELRYFCGGCIINFGSDVHSLDQNLSHTLFLTLQKSYLRWQPVDSQSWRSFTSWNLLLEQGWNSDLTQISLQERI